MKAKELRIGNIVYNSYSGKKEPVLAIISKDANLHFGGNQYSGYMFPSSKNIIDFDNVEPLPLAPEWLERLGAVELSGFKYNSHPTYHFNPNAYSMYEDWDEYSVCGSDLSLCIGENGGFRLLKNVCDDNHYNEEGIEVLYVHQLQNLFYSLTGKELPLREGAK